MSLQEIDEPGVYFKPGSSSIEIAVILPIEETTSHLSSAIVKHEIDKLREIVPQVKTAFIDRNNESGQLVLMVYMRVKTMTYKVTQFMETLVTCQEIAHMFKRHFELLCHLENAQRDLKPFSKEYVDDEQETKQPTAEA